MKNASRTKTYVNTVQGRAYEEMSPGEITHVLTQLKSRGVLLAKQQVENLMTAIADQQEYCAQQEQQNIYAKSQLETAIANKYLTVDEAKEWEEYFRGMTEAQAAALIKAYPPEMEPILSAMASLTINAAKLEEVQNWLNFYEKLVKPTTQLVHLYEAEVSHSQRDERKYEKIAAVAAEKRQGELLKARDRILIDRQSAEVARPAKAAAESTVVEKAAIDEPKDDAEAILSVLRQL